MLVAVMGFMFVYLVIALRLFDVCVVENLRSERNVAEAPSLEVMPDSPIKRADITDRNGTIIATSLTATVTCAMRSRRPKDSLTL